MSNVCEDRHGTLWFSTDRGGLCRYDYDTDAFRSYSLGEGMPDNVTYRVLEDSEGMLWLGTNYGLVRFNPETEKNPHLHTPQRPAWQPVQLPRRPARPRREILVRRIRRHRRFRSRTTPFLAQARTGPLHHGTEHQQRGAERRGEGSPPRPESALHRPHHPRTQPIEHQSPFCRHQFLANRLDRLLLCTRTGRHGWIAADRSRPISFAQLQPGNYTFRIRAVNRNGGWQSAERSLKIVIRPPWWGTGLAKIAYLLIVAGGAAAGFRYYLRRKRKQILEQQRLFEAEKEKELYGAKIDFFTEIAHEVRTPLTLIKGPLEDIMEMNADPKLEKNLHVIHKNTQRLLELIRQLLDFRNVDSNKMRLDFVRFDIPMQLQCIVERFEPTIEKGASPDAPPRRRLVQAAADREALTKIVSNLLNNALKYAEHEIEVALEHNGETFSVRVTSDGEKIPIHLSEKDFRTLFPHRPHGAGSRAGIGLPMARSLAQLHKGICSSTRRLRAIRSC